MIIPREKLFFRT